MWGYEVLPGIALGALLVNFLHSVPLLPSIGIAAGNSASALFGVYVLGAGEYSSRSPGCETQWALLQPRSSDRWSRRQPE